LTEQDEVYKELLANSRASTEHLLAIHTSLSSKVSSQELADHADKDEQRFQVLTKEVSELRHMLQRFLVWGGVITFVIQLLLNLSNLRSLAQWLTTK